MDPELCFDCGTVVADDVCTRCGDPMCSRCLDEGLCRSCWDEDPIMSDEGMGSVLVDDQFISGQGPEGSP
jgi:predicted amidophosphoribosyltransferase